MFEDMSIIVTLGVFVLNGVIEVALFVVNELSLVVLLACALVFTRWEIAEHQEISSGIGPDEVAL